MKCEIINDLLPLYCDGLTSEASNEEIENHLKECGKCSSAYETMKTECKTDIPDINIEPLKKVRKNNKLKIIAGFAAGLILLSIVFCFMFVGVVPASSEDVSVTYSGEILENGTISIDFYLETEEGWALGSRGKCLWISPEGTTDYYMEETGTPYKVFKLPFDYRGENTHIFNADFFRENGNIFNDGDTYTIKFRDGDITFYLKEIAEELGLQ